MRKEMRITLRIEGADLEALEARAEYERIKPSTLARRLIVEGLRRLGALREEEPRPKEVSVVVRREEEPRPKGRRKK